MNEDIIAGLPISIRRRFSSLGGYVRAVIDEDEREVADVVRTSKTSLDAITTVVTAMAVARFLRDGSEAAKRAVRPEHILKNESLGGAALLLRTHIRNG
jgi:hypothetical protein